MLSAAFANCANPVETIGPHYLPRRKGLGSPLKEQPTALAKPLALRALRSVGKQNLGPPPGTVNRDIEPYIRSKTALLYRIFLDKRIFLWL